MRVPKALAPVACLVAVCVIADSGATGRAESSATRSAGMDVLYAAPGDLNYVYGETGDRLTALTAEATATFVVTYNGFDAASQAAFQAAVNIWANTIVSPAPIRIVANWTPLATGVLGSAGPSQFCARTIGGTQSFYAAALADKLNGSAYCSISLDREITANFNSAFTSWEFGTAGTPVAGKYNFMTVVMHEIGHGLGFLGSMSVSSADNTGSFFSPPIIYDRFAITGSGAPLIGFVNPSLALGSQLVSNNTFFNGPAATGNNGGANPKLDTHNFGTANGWRQGSSYSHADDAVYTGTPNGLMTPSLNSAEVYTDVGPIVRGVFQDEGWTITPAAPVTFTLTVAANGTGGGTVTSSPAGITCPSDCSEAYNSGTVVTLTASASAGSTFAGWSGACTGTGTCQVTMNADTAATATFNLIPLSAQDRIAIGLTTFSNQGGWLATRKGADLGYSAGPWTLLPWAAYDGSGGGLHVAAGDVDGDGLDEVVVGLGSGGQGWIAVFDDAAHGYALLKWILVAWPQYDAANGEVWPAVGDIDGDGRAEIVAGLGQGGQGYFQIFDDAANSYASIGFRQVTWAAYAGGANGSTHPAIANVDGVGTSEIVVGLGSGGAGWVEIFTGSSGGFLHQSWFQSTWTAYDSSNGTTFPAAGDLDGDGRAEIVIGFGTGGGGWLEIMDDANAAYAHLFWLRTSWDSYNASSSGETHPAVGNVDNDSRAEIVIGLAPFTAGNGGWVEIRDDAAGGYASLGWRNTEWTAYQASGGGTFPAVGKFR